MIREACAALLLALAATPAVAQQICASRDVLVDSLSKDYSESVLGLGMDSEGNVIELLTARDGTTWTLLITTPDGTSCVMSTGQSWESMPQTVAGRDA
ncbi:MAG: hypothetical protein HQL38_05065 [Alphaproteobacteria bacterium]|nr:hypothetical protein [Alphaproteobacteria bacterium]